MKIICVDNFDRDFKSDVLVCENVSEHYGKIIVRLLIEELSQEEDSPNFYRLVKDDYKLYKFEP